MRFSMPTGAVRCRLASDSAAVAVGGVAAALSWQHIVHVAHVYGHQAAWASYLYPVSVDGLMIVGVVKAADDRATGRKVRPWARVATWLGGIMSISAQVGSAYVFGWWAVAIAVAPSASLIAVTEVIARRGRLLPAPPVVEATEPVQPAETVPATVEAVTPPVTRARARKAASVAQGGQDEAPRPRRPRRASVGPMTTARGPELVTVERPDEVVSVP